MADTEKTIADVALEESKVGKTERGKTTASGYKPGVYRSDKFLRIIKKLSYSHSKDASGQVQKTYGTWAKDDNMIVFSKGVEKRLTEADLELESIRRLIDSKTIYRVGD